MLYSKIYFGNLEIILKPFWSPSRVSFMMNIVPRHDIVSTGGPGETNSKRKTLFEGFLQHV